MKKNHENNSEKTNKIWQKFNDIREKTYVKLEKKSRNYPRYETNPEKIRDFLKQPEKFREIREKIRKQSGKYNRLEKMPGYSKKSEKKFREIRKKIGKKSHE